MNKRSLVEEFQKVVAEGGLEAGIDFARGLPEERRQLLIAGIESGGAGWVAIWLSLRVGPDEK